MTDTLRIAVICDLDTEGARRVARSGTDVTVTASLDTLLAALAAGKHALLAPLAVVNHG